MNPKKGTKKSQVFPPFRRSMGSANWTPPWRRGASSATHGAVAWSRRRGSPVAHAWWDVELNDIDIYVLVWKTVFWWIFSWCFIKCLDFFGSYCLIFVWGTLFWYGNTWLWSCLMLGIQWPGDCSVPLSQGWFVGLVWTAVPCNSAQFYLRIKFWKTCRFLKHQKDNKSADFKPLASRFLHFPMWSPCVSMLFLPFSEALTAARLLQRRDRFLADAWLNLRGCTAIHPRFCAQSFLLIGSQILLSFTQIEILSYMSFGEHSFRKPNTSPWLGRVWTRNEDVVLDSGEEEVAYCVNPGRVSVMKKTTTRVRNGCPDWREGVVLRIHAEQPIGCLKNWLFSMGFAWKLCTIFGTCSWLSFCVLCLAAIIDPAGGLNDFPWAFWDLTYPCCEVWKLSLAGVHESGCPGPKDPWLNVGWGGCWKDWDFNGFHISLDL